MITRYKNPVIRRKIRTRAKIKKISTRPRITVHRSNKHIYAQLIDSETGKVLAAASDIKAKSKLTKSKSAFEVGRNLAKSALKKNITRAVFDRGPYKYHGRIKAVSQGARKESLII